MIFVSLFVSEACLSAIALRNRLMMYCAGGSDQEKEKGEDIAGGGKEEKPVP